MKLKNVLIVGLASSALLSGSVLAASWNVSAFDANAYSGIAQSQIEDFESYTVNDLGLWDETKVTNVGTFNAFNPNVEGGGSTCDQLNSGDCGRPALSNTVVNGQGNITPTPGSFSLQANDSLGIIWNASLRDGGAFTDIIFGIRDAADQSGTTVTITLEELGGAELASPIFTTITNQSNSAMLLVSIALGQAVTSAKISMVNSVVNDSYTFDGGALYLSEVPLPAAAWLFLSALGGASVLRRVRAKA